MAVRAMVFLVVQSTFVPVGAGDILRLKPMFTVNAPQCQRFTVYYLKFRLKIFGLCFLHRNTGRIGTGYSKTALIHGVIKLLFKGIIFFRDNTLFSTQ